MKKIFLTVDTECHDIARINQYIYGKKGDKEYGLKNILEFGKKMGIVINFMVDICEQKRYGKEYLEKIIRLIESYGQPIYFHLHPNYITGDEAKTFLWQYSKNEQKSIFSESLSIFESYRGHDGPIIFRAGRYGVNSDFYDVLNEEKRKVLDLSYFYGNMKMCKFPYEKARVKNAATLIGQVTLIPNTTYIGFDYFGKKNSFILNVADTTKDEFKRLIKQTKLNNLVYTMHSWDFIKKFFFNKEYVSENKMVKNRLSKTIEIARQSGFVFSDLNEYAFVEEEDEMVNLCSGFNGKIKGLANNFIRFYGIARLNKRYFFIYLLSFVTLFALIGLVIVLCVISFC